MPNSFAEKKQLSVGTYGLLGTNGTSGTKMELVEQKMNFLVIGTYYNWNITFNK